jgi:hypothetical protein
MFDPSPFSANFSDEFALRMRFSSCSALPHAVQALMQPLKVTALGLRPLLKPTILVQASSDMLADTINTQL